jgi:hypothetical protein
VTCAVTAVQVMFLPIESKSCRMLVRKRYVMNRGGDNVWHDHLIRHFQVLSFLSILMQQRRDRVFVQREATCMRRCEELPWHLQLCRKWYTLKDTLTDLKTFELMFSSDLKHELMVSYQIQGCSTNFYFLWVQDYWMILSEGPLFLTSEAAKAAQVMLTKLAMERSSASQQALLKGIAVNTVDERRCLNG